MDAIASQPQGAEVTDLVAELPGRVIVALDHLTKEEQSLVHAAAQAFARHELAGARLPAPEPLFLVRAAPHVLLIVRQEPGVPVVVEDIVRPATWHTLAHAG